MSIWLRRAYEKPTRNDGFRVLVDRLWPRGVSKEYAEIDLWLKDIAPSKDLRKWFGHDPEKWEDFKKKYFKELKDKKQYVDKLVQKAKDKRITLVYGAKDEEHNNAIALKEYLKEKINE